MKKSLKVMMVLAFVAMASLAYAGEHPQIPADNSSAALNRIKELKGKWTSTTSMFGKKNQKIYTEYSVVAGGSAVLERFMPGTPQEMVSMYYDNKGKLTMTHYCLMRNRPTLALSQETPDSLAFKLVKVEDLKSKKDPHMGDVALHFKDKNHLSTSCSGKDEKQPPMTMEFTRVK